MADTIVAPDAATTPTAPAASGGAKQPGFLERETAGMPNWVWLLVIAGGFVVALVVRRFTANAGATSDTTSATDTSGQAGYGGAIIDPSTGLPYGNPYGYGAYNYPFSLPGATSGSTGTVSGTTGDGSGTTSTTSTGSAGSGTTSSTPPPPSPSPIGSASGGTSAPIVGGSTASAALQSVVASYQQPAAAAPAPVRYLVPLAPNPLPVASKPAQQFIARHPLQG